ncbi:hypothetical protein ACP4OV_012567 [Aristida adscensionis]
MELLEPSRSFSAWKPEITRFLGAAMDARQLAATPVTGGSGSNGNGGHSALHTYSRRQRRISSSSSGTSLMPQFNDAVDGGGSGSSSSSLSSGRLDIGLDDSHNRHRQRVRPETSPAPNHARRLLLLSPAGSPATDDDVLIMDGVLVENSESGTRRSASSFGIRRSVPSMDNNASGTAPSATLPAAFTDPGLVSSAGSPGSSSGGGRYNFNGQFARVQENLLLALGAMEPRGMQTMRPRFSEMEWQSSWPAPFNMMGSPITPPRFLTGFGLPIAVPRGLGAAATIRPPPSYFSAPASYFTPTRVTVRAAMPAPSPPRTPPGSPSPPPPPPLEPRPDTPPSSPPPQQTAFAWPPTAEEDASISARLYGPSAGARLRLPVFKDICPGE